MLFHCLPLLSLGLICYKTCAFCATDEACNRHDSLPVLTRSVFVSK